MSKHPHRTTVLASISVMLALVLTFTLKTHSASAVDCVGKPYGYPGCPTRSASSSSAGSRTGYCGNAILEDTEQCDKGRFNGKTECSTDCKVLYCGDGLVTKDIDEECEPQTQEFYIQDSNGNLTTEVRFTGANACGWYCQPPTCNDAGVCSGGCKLKYVDDCPADSSSSGATSSSGSGEQHSAAPASSSTATSAVVSSSPPITPVCGDGIRQVGEECDDGNKNPVDGCTNDCKAARCGNGLVEQGEECDDGNKVDTDACANTCSLARCGDGILQGKEQCDDGQRNSDIVPNGCRTNCLNPRCGDGVLDTGEKCDTGERNSDTQPNACRTSCQPPSCGDNVVDRGEQCDAGLQNSDTQPNGCRMTCKLASCGDGILDGNEECDDGNRIDTDQCTNICKRPRCGDGVVQNGEQCDWGTKNSDTLPNTCRTACMPPSCGDRVVDAGEQCDGGAECLKDCKLKPGAKLSTSSAHGSAPTEASGGFGPALPIALAGFGVFMIVGSLVFRRRIVALFAAKGTSIKDIDDIPLDQIEMPWHKW